MIIGLKGQTGLKKEIDDEINKLLDYLNKIRILRSVWWHKWQETDAKTI
jgi:hypothetical protein